MNPLRWMAHLDLTAADLAAVVAGGMVVTLATTLALGIAERLALPIGLGASVAILLVAVVAVFRRVDARADEARSQIEATLGLYWLLNPQAPLPQMRGYAMLPDSLLKLASIVLARRPRIVVETGSGASSIVTGYCLRAAGQGHLYCLEASLEHAERTRAEVLRHGLSNCVTVLHAPLRDVRVGSTNVRWHDTAGLADLRDIDLVIDDGPPRELGRWLRRASLPCLSPRMSKDAALFMNYIGADERKILHGWRKEHPGISVEMLGTRKGNAFVRLGAFDVRTRSEPDVESSPDFAAAVSREASAA